MNDYDKKLRTFKRGMIYNLKDITNNEYLKLSDQDRKKVEWNGEKGKYQAPVEDDIIDKYDTGEVLLMAISRDISQVKNSVHTIKNIVIFWFVLTMMSMFGMFIFILKFMNAFRY